MQDLFYIFNWWVVFFLLGLITLPLTIRIFPYFVDKGYIFSKVLGMLFISYAVFTFATFKFIPSSQTSLVVFLIILGALNLFIIWRSKDFAKTLRNFWKIFLFEEALFLLALTSWSYVRGFEPSIHGLEKYMDFGFVNSVLRTEYFPAKDLWLTPLSINYYYFGHIVTAVLTKISGTDAAITYNLMIATLFAFAFVCAFSIGLNLFHKKLTSLSVAVGLLYAFLLSLGGNLHTIYAYFAPYNSDQPVPFWTLPLDFNVSNYWYPNATRFIPFTIHEFPIYSFVVSDLHGHVLSIPIVLTIISILFSLIISKSEIRNPKQTQNTKRFENWNLFRYSILDIRILLLAFLLATAYMTNAWDGLIYFLLAVLVVFITNKNHIRYTIYSILLLGIGFVLFSFPFSHYFKPTSLVSGIGIVCAPNFLVNMKHLGPFLFEADHCGRSQLWQLAILHGFWYFWVISFFAFLYKKYSSWKEVPVSDIFVVLLIGISTVLILTPEFFYAKDIYPAHYRANTMFKLGYEAFMMLALSSSYIIIRIVLSIKHQIPHMGFLKRLFAACYLLLATFLIYLVLSYPSYAIMSYYGDLKNYKGLYGLTYLQDLYPTDFAAIKWLSKNIQGQPVILEGAGESYTDYARISSNTGLPTVIGWPVHEWLWRGTYDEAGKRVGEVEQMYTTHDLVKTKELLQKYAVQYVFIGLLERQKYPTLFEEKFQKLGTVVYTNEETTIFQVNKNP